MSESWLNLANKVCVITGAAGGMGKKICLELAEQHAKLVLVDLDEDKLTKLASSIKAKFDVEIMRAVCDTTDEDQVSELVEKVAAKFNKCDVLVNTAGILKFAPLEKLSYKTWKKVLNVNLDGYFLMAQHFGKLMMKHEGGSMVHISTVASEAPETYSVAYSTSKAGVNMLSKQLAAEWGQFGIRSNVIMPCLVKTPMSMGFYSDPDVENGRKELTASKRIGTVSDIADSVLFLASNRSDYVNGAELPVDGGFHMMMGDQIPKPGGRKQYALDHLSD